jgi:phospholipid/cholesterol/gamma-HCH transport system substrate-binding protein
MRRRSVANTLTSSPTMVGAITTLIVIITVFLAYNANTGLPFVPTYRVSVEVPNAERLRTLNDVRIGGDRVGLVESMHAEPASSASSGATARLDLKLDESVDPLPQDSRFRVRYRSAFGLKYLEITRGTGQPAPEGFIFDDPASFVEQTEFDDIYNTFDAPTRRNVRINLTGFGDALTGRGTSLNDAISALRPLFTDLAPVARVLAERDTRLRRLFPRLADAARIIAPVADEQAELFTNAAVALAAISEDPEALKESISGAVPALETGIETLPPQRPFLRDATTLTRALGPGVRALRVALPDLNDAVRVGTPVLRRAPHLNTRLRGTFRSLNRLVERPSTGSALSRLGDLFDEARPLAAGVAPAQTVCNYWNYWFTFLPEHLSERDQVGFTQRVAIVGFPLGDVTVDSQADPALPPTEITVPGDVQTSLMGYSGLAANGKAGAALDPPEGGEFRPYELPILHGPVYQPAGRRGADCQSGQTGYPLGDLRVPGQPADSPAVIASDYPGSRGPTTLFYNRNRDRALVDTRVPGRQPNR